MEVNVKQAQRMFFSKSSFEMIYFEAFAIAMVIYFILTFACSRLLRLWENRMDGPDNFDLATTDTLAHTSGLYSYNDKAAKKAKVGDLNSDSREGR